MAEYTCPECGSDQVLVYTQTAYWINTDEYLCHSSKTFDATAKVRCICCEWEGLRKDIDPKMRGEDRDKTDK